jgi:hypothetical protein
MVFAVLALKIRHSWRAAAIGALLVGIAGCARKAPGPVDCERFALRVFGVHDQRQLAVPILRERVNLMTLRCITTPYDRELLACVEQGAGGGEMCMADFRVRHPERVARDMPIRVR